MTEILMVCGLYVFVYSFDYFRLWCNETRYKYVSYGTFWQFFGAILTLLYLFHMELDQYFSQNFASESFFLLFAYFFGLILSTCLYQTKERVCYQIGRAYKCLVPLYIAVKAKDLLFQQLCYLLLAIFVSREIGFGFDAALSYVVMLLIINIPMVIGATVDWKRYVLIGSALLAIPFFYTYTKLGLFWPAMYLHAILYVFVWITALDAEDLAKDLGKSL